ncbi:hypothetical protein DFH09DRAFT_1112507 [Mycena vulgaris]|nr:hypothetical protein DFH09DRAFT_1112507 [Mycena vulgaris]
MNPLQRRDVEFLGNNFSYSETPDDRWGHRLHLEASASGLRSSPMSIDRQNDRMVGGPSALLSPASTDHVPAGTTSCVTVSTDPKPRRNGQVATLARGTSGAPPSRMTLSDVYALVKSMEARMVAQETKLNTQEEEILVLKRDSSELWQEIHRMIQISGSMDEASENPPMRRMDGFLRLVPKFVALCSLELSYLDLWDVQWIQRSMPQSMKKNIKEMWIDWPQDDMSEFAVFVSTFTALETLSYGSGDSWYGEPSDATQDLVSPPPSSIRELSFRNSDPNVTPTVLKWFADLHSGSTP